MWLDLELESDIRELPSFQEFCKECEYVNMFNDTEEIYKASIQLLPEGEVL